MKKNVNVPIGNFPLFVHCVKHDSAGFTGVTGKQHVEAVVKLYLIFYKNI